MTTVGSGSPSEEVTDHPQHNISNASIEEDLKVRTEVSIHASSPEIPPLGEPENKRRSWFQRRTKYDADSIATQVRNHTPMSSLIRSLQSTDRRSLAYLMILQSRPNISHLQNGEPSLFSRGE